MEPAVMTRCATLVLGLAAGLLCLSHAPAARAQAGALSQLAGTDGCVSEDGSAGACAEAEALIGPIAVALSPDGRSAYAAPGGLGLVILARDKKTGVLTQLAGTDGCVTEDGRGGACAAAVAIDDPTAIAVSPKGTHVYVTSTLSDAVAIFARDKKTGVLTQLPGTDGCVSEDGSGGACADGKALDLPIAIAVSRKGTNVYVGSAESWAVAVFARQKK